MVQIYSKLVYIDADIFVLPTCSNIDRLFEYTAPAAALDRGANGFVGESRQCGLVSAHSIWAMGHVADRVQMLGARAGSAAW
jgi:hypothetical protein